MRVKSSASIVRLPNCVRGATARGNEPLTADGSDLCMSCDHCFDEVMEYSTGIEPGTPTQDVARRISMSSDTDERIRKEYEDRILKRREQVDNTAVELIRYRAVVVRAAVDALNSHQFLTPATIAAVDDLLRQEFKACIDEPEKCRE